MFYISYGFVSFIILVRAQIKRPSVCDLPRDPGPCKARIPAWFFEQQTSTCTRFYYGGCGDNRNRFESKEMCKKTCRQHKGRPSLCDSRPDTGPCKARIPAFYFDPLTGTCKSFIYGGCGGNKNCFTSQDTCFETCSPSVSPCKLPLDPGPCQYRVAAWFFDRSTKSCKHFIYGGCGGNENRFRSEKDCREKCLAGKRPTPVCSRDLHIRSCIKGPQWYFNASLGSCNKLPIRKCSTSANKFETCVECVQTCTRLMPQTTCKSITKSLPGPGNSE